MKQLTAPLQDKLEYLKNPVVAEFLGFKNNTDYTESDLEQSIIDHLIQFLMELGKGFAFVDRQKSSQFCAYRLKNLKTAPSGRWADGYVCENVR